MAGPNGFLARYQSRRWCTVPVHRPNPDDGTCSCGKPDCAKPGKHPDGRFWPGGSSDPAHFTDRNIGVRLGPDSQNLADVDLDCQEAVVVGPALLPLTDSTFGRAGRVTHGLYTVPARDASYLKLQDPVLTGDRATIVELRWPEWDEDEQRFKNIQTVFPPSLHHTGGTVTWLRDGTPAEVAGADLAASVRHVGAAVLLARYAKPKERHALVLLLANLLVRAGWEEDAKVVRFIAAVFTAKNDADKARKVTDGEGLGAVKDARKRLKANKPMKGLPALKEMLDPTLDTTTPDKVVANIKDWLGIPDPTGHQVTGETAPSGRKPSGEARRYTPLPPWRPLPVEHLPGPVGAFVRTVSRAMRCDPTFVALPTLAVCGGMIGSTRTIRLKRSWYEPAMIWAVVVGESGTLKSPPYKRAVAPVIAMQAAHIKEHRAAAETHRAELRDYERQKKRARDTDPGDPPVPPVCTRIYSRDTTIEALGGLLVDNQKRFLIGRDEVSGWLSSFNQYKAKGGSDQANWLELHSLGTLCVDRKTGEPKTIFISDVGVSLCGGIQPGVLRHALTPQHFSAGVPARLLFAYPPRKPKEWTEDDIDEAVETKYQQLIKKLSELEPHTDEDDVPYPVALGMTPEAKAEWVRFYGRFAAKQAETEGELAAAFSKLEGYAARLALVHHVCQSVTANSGALEPVSVESIRAGIALAEWFTYEAERVYQMLGEETEEAETRKLVEVVTRLAERYGGRVTARQLQKSNNRKYRSSDEAEAVLELLVRMGLGSWQIAEVPERGGHRVRYFVACTPHDTSDTRPDPDGPDDFRDGGERHDTRPPAPDPPPGGGSASPDANPQCESTCGDESGGERERVSEVSCGVHEPADRADPKTIGRNGGSECRAPTEPSVVRGEGARPRTLVCDPEKLAKVAAVLKGGNGLVGLDLETTGLSHARDRVRLLSLATPSETFLIDQFRVDPVPLWPVLAGVEVVGHNLGFDLPFLMKLGFVPGRVRDTMLASQVLHAGDRSIGHALKELAHRHLGLAVDKELQTADWSGCLSEAHLEYAARDAELPLALWEKLTAEITSADLTGTVETEMVALPAVAWAAYKGIGFDREAWEAVAAETEVSTARLREQLDELLPNAGNLFGVTNWNSLDEVTAAFAALGVELTSTDDDTLAAVTHPAAALLRQYRAASKLSGTYGREWLRHVANDGRVYATWKQIGAGASGRMSCKEPNLQQLPRDPRYRRCFTAPPGRVLVKADYSQIELRIAAKIAGDERMLDAYHRGEDLHTTTARAVLGKNEVSKADRQLAKSLNFGLLYGMGAKSLAAYAASNFGVSLTAAEAATHRDAFFRTYPGLRTWHRSVPSGTLQTRTLAGRRRVGVSAFTEKLNTPTQGTGADGLRRALALLWERRAACPDAFPVLLVHDEIVVECDEGKQNEVAVWVRDAMRDGMAPLLDPVPVEVEVSAGRTWGG
jgi:DNA polymerase I-like protein with 3'-5' exonuclease and polymerase domains